jgi:hypothetical protein
MDRDSARAGKTMPMARSVRIGFGEYIAATAEPQTEGPV